jgi:hypothetical protein
MSTSQVGLFFCNHHSTRLEKYHILFQILRDPRRKFSKKTNAAATDYGHTKAKSLILCSPIQIPIPNKYLLCGYKGSDISAENTPNAIKFVCPICLHKPKSLEIQ